MAWHAEALARQARLPSLTKFLSRRPAPAAARQQSPDEMLAVFQAIAANGAPMTIRKVR